MAACDYAKCAICVCKLVYNPDYEPEDGLIYCEDCFKKSIREAQDEAFERAAIMVEKHDCMHCGFVGTSQESGKCIPFYIRSLKSGEKEGK